LTMALTLPTCCKNNREGCCGPAGLVSVTVASGLTQPIRVAHSTVVETIAFITDLSAGGY
jgi:hypothetical protein